MYIDIARFICYNITILGEGAFNARGPRKGEMTMPVSKAQQRATAKYEAKAYDKLLLRLQKGRKDVIQAHAAAQGESVNGFINRAIDSQMDRDASRSPAEAAGAHAGSGAVSLPSDTLKAAREAAEAAGEELPAFVTRAVEETADRDGLPKEVIFGRAVDVIASHYEVSCWDVLDELKGLAEKGGEANE